MVEPVTEENMTAQEWRFLSIYRALTGPEKEKMFNLTVALGDLTEAENAGVGIEEAEERILCLVTDEGPESPMRKYVMERRASRA